MQDKYRYNGEDITVDMMFKIEHIVNILAESENKDFDTVFAEFAASETYKRLQQTDNLLWAESSEYIADEYINAVTQGQNTVETRCIASLPKGKAPKPPQGA